MTVYIKELKQGFKAFCIWTASIAFMTLVCIIMFPEMKNEMDSVTDVFANMGGFTAAFGMDRLSFGELMGFYGIECGNIIGLGGGFFAALTGVSALAKEEKDRTAEFLLTHPVSRFSVVTQKLLSVLTQVVLLNIIVAAVNIAAAAAIGEQLETEQFILLHIAYLLMQTETACVCFGISAFIKRGSIGIGLGTSLALYFMNIICNISDSAEFLRWVTPYAYAEASNIISESKLEYGLIAVGMGIAAVGVAAGYFRYLKKDIAA